MCGVHPSCNVVGSREALSRAKRNVERFFPVVGVLEMLEETLEVMEEAFPEFLGGIAGKFKAKGGRCTWYVLYL